jgi:RNA polymerase sigma factor (sigma-70 family)
LNFSTVRAVSARVDSLNWLDVVEDSRAAGSSPQEPVTTDRAIPPPIIHLGGAFMHQAEPSSPHDLLGRAREGDQQAWAILFNDCYPKVVRVVRRRLSRPMRKMYDSTDIANEVMKSLAAKFHDFDFSSINGLRAFLIHAAEQKVVDGYRKGYAQKRDLARDRTLTSDDDSGFEPADSSPTASQVAVASEEEEILLEGQSGEHRTVLELKLQGCSNSEVARTTGWHIRKIERFLEKLRGTWHL